MQERMPIMAISELFRGPKLRETAARLYVTLVQRSRAPVFYARLETPDTLDGRFEMIMLHAFLVLARLRRIDGMTSLSQAVFDALFDDMDRALREMGTGDLSVGKQVKFMAKSLYGRIAAYESALAIPSEAGLEDPLAEALRRNLYGTVVPSVGSVTAMATYVREQSAMLETCEAAEFGAGVVRFGALPA